MQRLPRAPGLRKMPENPPAGSLEAVFYIPAAAKSAPDFHFFHRESGISAYSVSLPVPSPLFPGKSKETVVEPCLRSGSRAFVKGKYTGRSVGIFCR